ncbi:hypothetical protein MVEG_09175 [Podila verticillata NRRL 6337]|nr:hypothetical protein MVEG_09175 [Podila verticillata NRRL 6337]
MLSPLLQNNSLSWVVHQSHALAASIPPLPPKTAPVHIHVFSFGHGVISSSEAGQLVKCKEYQLFTNCTSQPSILFFGLVSSEPEVLLRPLLFLYDSALKILECHEIRLFDSSRIGYIDVTLDYVQTLSVTAGPKLIVLCRDSKSPNLDTINLLEWSPLLPSMLHTRLQVREVLGIVELESGDKWQLLYYPPGGKDFTLCSAVRSELFVNPNLMQERQVFHIRTAIPDVYRSNLRYIYASTCRAPDIHAVHRIWVHTRKGEFAYFEGGKLQWSKSLPGRVSKTELVRSIGNAHRSCLSVQTEYSTHLYDSLSGKLLEEWPHNKSVLFADVWSCGRSVAVALPTSIMVDCLSYSTFPVMSIDTSIPLTTSSQSASREKTSLECAQGMVGLQMDIWLQKSERFKSALSSKRDTIQRCRISLSEDSRSMFALGRPLSTKSLNDSPTFRTKRDLYRRRVLERLTPIIGATVQSSSTAACPNPISSMESTAGWVVSCTRTLLWVSVEIKNETEGILENLRLCTVGLSSRGHTVSTLHPRSTCNVACVMEIRDYRAKSMMNSLPGQLRLHYNQPSTLGFSARMPCTVAIPRVALVPAVTPAWNVGLADLVLPYFVRYNFKHIHRDRIQMMIQDGLGLSSADNALEYGSVEEGLVVTISSKDDSSRTWTACFQAGQESDAQCAAHQAVEMSSSFCV